MKKFLTLTTLACALATPAFAENWMPLGQSSTGTRLLSDRDSVTKTTNNANVPVVTGRFEFVPGHGPFLGGIMLKECLDSNQGFFYLHDYSDPVNVSTKYFWNGVITDDSLAADTMGGALCGAIKTDIKAESPTPTDRIYYTHNDSLAYGVEDNNHSGSETGGWSIFYYKPRAGMLEAGAKPDDLLFRGMVHDNGRVDGTSYSYKGRCGQYPFDVTGFSTLDKRTIAVEGNLPNVNRRCQVNGAQHVKLDFDVVPLN